MLSARARSIPRLDPLGELALLKLRYSFHERTHASCGPGPDDSRVPGLTSARCLRPLLVLVIAGGLAGCSSGSSSQGRTIAEENFLHSVHKLESSFTKGRSDDNLVKLGRNNCDGLDSGLSIDDIGRDIMRLDPTLKPEDVGSFITVSIVTLCPAHTNEIGHPSGGG